MKNKTEMVVEAYKHYKKFESQVRKDCEDEQTECARSVMGLRLWLGRLECETREYNDVQGNRINFRTKSDVNTPDVEECDKTYNPDTFEYILSHISQEQS